MFYEIEPGDFINVALVVRVEITNKDKDGCAWVKFITARKGETVEYLLSEDEQNKLTDFLCKQS